MPNRIFKPNAFLVLKHDRPILLVLPNLPVKASIVVSPIFLNWNTTKNKRFSDYYHTLTDHLLENLPKGRKFKGGVFQAQVHEGKLASGDKEIYAKNLQVTVGDYAGDDIRSAMISVLRRKLKLSKKNKE